MSSIGVVVAHDLWIRADQTYNQFLYSMSISDVTAGVFDWIRADRMDDSPTHDPADR